jgi:hypothetical protein
MNPHRTIEVTGVVHQNVAELQGDFVIAAGATGADHGFDAGPEEPVRHSAKRSPQGGSTAPLEVCLCPRWMKIRPGKMCLERLLQLVANFSMRRNLPIAAGRAAVSTAGQKKLLYSHQRRAGQKGEDYPGRASHVPIA